MTPGKEYTTDDVRNVVFLGHGGSGKTTLIDTLCYVAGTSRRRGDVDAGQALTMTTPEESAHNISMQLTVAHAEWMGTKVNALDTPGYLDFTGEAVAGSRVGDSAVVVLGSTSGVEVGTEVVWEYCEERGLPRIFFVSQMDKENADFDAVYQDIKEQLTDKVLPVEIPIGSGDDFRGIINLFSQRAHIYEEGTEKGEYEEGDIPEELQAKFQEWETELQETLATTDERLLDKYLEGGGITRDEAIEAMARAVARGEIFPLFCGSAKRTYGMRALLSKIVELMPNPAEAGAEIAVRPGLDQEVTLLADDDEAFAALVFKTTTEPHVGELSFFKVVSGVAVNGMEAENPGRGATEKLNHLSIPMGKERHEVDRIHAGDIGVVAKLRDTHTNDTLCSPARTVKLREVRFPQPDISVAIEGETRADEDKLGEVLPKLHEEDPTFVAEFNPELGQTIARGLGELHLDVQFERMKRKYSVSVNTARPKIAYRETITRPGEGQGRHKKQTGGRGQFGDCWVRFEPLPPGSGFEFEDSIKGGVIPNKFIPSVEKGVKEAASRGILAGYQVVDFRAVVYDGSYHSVDSSDVAFQVAASQAFKKVTPGCGPVLLEPLMEVEVTTPDEFVGDIMGDITQRRGKVMGMDPQSGKTVIKARIPEAELYKYAAALRSMTQGRAHHTRSFVGYERVPQQEAEKIIADSQKEEAS